MNEASSATKKVRSARQACSLLFALGLLGLVGCLGESNLLDDDPIRGGRPIPTNATTTAPSARAVSDGSPPNANPTALPLPNGPTSPAALVSGGSSLTSPPPVAVQPPEIGVKVGGPQPVTSRLTPIAATNTDGGGTGIIQTSAVGPASVSAANSSPATLGATYEQLQDMLAQRGVTWQRLRTGTAKGEWIFECSIPDPKARQMEIDYVAHAVGPYGLDAIRAVLKEIDDERGGR